MLVLVSRIGTEKHMGAWETNHNNLPSERSLVEMLVTATQKDKSLAAA